MKIIIANPPVYDLICKALGTPPKNAVFTYGDKLCNPSNGFISPDLMKHEETHSRQQLYIGPDLWWKKYLKDPQFRLENEIEAYQIQFAYFCAKNKDRNAQTRLLHTIAGDLASPMYGGIITKEDAIKQIRL